MRGTGAVVCVNSSSFALAEPVGGEADHCRKSYTSSQTIRALKERARRTSSSRLARDNVREDGLENVGVRYIM